MSAEIGVGFGPAQRVARRPDQLELGASREPFNWPLVLLAYAVVCVIAIVKTLHGLDTTPLLKDTDDAMRLVTVRDLLAGQNWFDHTQYRDEVVERWGAEAYATSDAWWRAQSPEQKRAWQARVKLLGSDWIEAAQRGVDPASDEAQALARRQFDWLSGIPGTPQTADGHPTKEYFTGLGEMYVADERFAANYGGADGAAFVRDAMAIFADRNL